MDQVMVEEALRVLIRLLITIFLKGEGELESTARDNCC